MDIGEWSMNPMLCRVADAIYWLNRSIERAENLSRFIDVNLMISMDMPAEIPEQWEPLILTTGDMEYFKENYKDATRSNVIQFLTFDRNYHSSILSCLKQARENARTVREIISSEMWNQINHFYHHVESSVNKRMSNPEKLGEFYAEIKTGSHLFTGIMDATFSHSEGWEFGMLGRYLERANQTSRILDMKYFYLLPSVDQVGSTVDLLQWIALLKSVSAFEMYRKEFGKPDAVNIVNFLLFDRNFPRSVYKSLKMAEKSLSHITGSTGDHAHPAERELGKLRNDLKYTTTEEIFKNGLHEYLDKLQQRMNTVGVEIHNSFFSF